MLFSGSTHHNIPKPIKYANSDSTPFIQDYHTPSPLSKPLKPSSTPNYNTNLFSKSIPFTKTNDNSFFKTIIKTHHDILSLDKSRHPSQNQSILFNTQKDRNTKTHYNLRHQPKKDYRLFIPHSQLPKLHHTELNENW